MDGHRFDELTRRFARSASRRGILKGLAGGLAGAVGLGAVGRRAPAAAQPAPCTHGRPCTVTAQCCPTEVCGAGGVCQPGPGTGRASCVAAGCPPSGDPCQTYVCNRAAGACDLENVADDTPCGLGSACCAGNCTSLTTNQDCGACGAPCTGANKTCTAAGQCVCTNSCPGHLVRNPSTCSCECPAGTTACLNTLASPPYTICCPDATRYCSTFVFGGTLHSTCLARTCTATNSGNCTTHLGHGCAASPDLTSNCLCQLTAESTTTCATLTGCTHGQPCTSSTECPEGHVCTPAGQFGDAPYRCRQVCPPTPA